MAIFKGYIKSFTQQLNWYFLVDNTRNEELELNPSQEKSAENTEIKAEKEEVLEKKEAAQQPAAQKKVDSTPEPTPVIKEEVVAKVENVVKNELPTAVEPVSTPEVKEPVAEQPRKVEEKVSRVTEVFNNSASATRVESKPVEPVTEVEKPVQVTPVQPTPPAPKATPSYSETSLGISDEPELPEELRSEPSPLAAAQEQQPAPQQERQSYRQQNQNRNANRRNPNQRNAQQPQANGKEAANGTSETPQRDVNKREPQQRQEPRSESSLVQPARRNERERVERVDKQEKPEQTPGAETQRRQPNRNQNNSQEKSNERSSDGRRDDRQGERNGERNGERSGERTNYRQRPQAQVKTQSEKTERYVPKLAFKKISIVIPLYNEEESLKPLASTIRSVMSEFYPNFEVIFVDDGSTDNSLGVLKEISRKDQRYHYISLQKNFGKSAALQVGFKNAKGEVVITMDADLQDDPREIPNLVKKLDEGYFLVSGWKKKRYDPFIKVVSSRFFNWVTSVFSGMKLHDFNCGLKAYRKPVVENIKLYGELHRFIPVLAKWSGYSVSEIAVHHHPRKYGKTKFGTSRFFKGFFDLLTVTFITRYIKRPMHLFGTMGAISIATGIGVNAYLSYEWLYNNVALSNRPLLLLGVLLMIVGVQFFLSGILGEMMVHNNQNDKEYPVKDLG